MASKRGIYSMVLNGDTTITVPWELISKDLSLKEYKATQKNFKQKEKYPLTVIDTFTTQFYTEGELRYILGKFFKMNVNKVEITYNENGRVNNATIAYKKHPEITKLAHNNFGSYDISEDELYDMACDWVAENVGGYWKEVKPWEMEYMTN